MPFFFSYASRIYKIYTKNNEQNTIDDWMWLQVEAEDGEDQFTIMFSNKLYYSCTVDKFYF